MKSMTKLMLVAMVLVAALVVAPAAARDIANTGDTVYIGEKNVNLFSVLNGTSSLPFDKGNLVYYSSVSNPNAATIGKIIPVTVDGARLFEVDASNFETRLGAWYAFNQTKTDLTNQSAADGYFLVDKPSTTLDVKLWDKTKSAMSTSSVKDKSVSRSDQIAFEIKHNIRLPDDVVENLDNGFQMEIEVSTPDGGKVTSLDGTSLKLNLTSTAANTTAITLDGLKPGIYTAQAKWVNTTAFEPEKPAPVTFEVRSKTLTLTSSKDSVVRGNHFVVTIQGESKTYYNVFVKSPDSDSAKNPMIVPSQPDVEPGKGVAGTNATVKTDAGGKIDVEFNTTTSTEDKQFTIRVEKPGASTDYDEVKVKVEKGSVTITASGSGVYYIGEEITLSGTCTDNGTAVHLFLTGPNLNSNGVNLKKIDQNVVDLDVNTFDDVEVKADDTWSRKWSTANLARALDAGGYTIYAVSQPQGKNNLSSVEYAIASIQLRPAYITATSSGAVVAKGDDLKIVGTAQGNPDNIRVWVFGKNYYGASDGTLNPRSVNVEADGSFEFELKGGETGALSAGQYYAVLHHPMTKSYGIDADSNSGRIYGVDENKKATGQFNATLTNLQASAAATALINALESANIDDTYMRLSFVVEEANIWIDAIGDKAAGSTFTITGTTNLAVGDTLNIDVTSAAFKPTTKEEATGFANIAGTAEVKQGDGANTWSFEVDGSSFKPDQYIVKVESIETRTTMTANFNVVEAVPTTQATPTATGTAVTTPTATATTEATPTQSPGFGALLALAGLGAVAFLVLRRD